MIIYLDNRYDSEGAYCPNGFSANYKQNQYLYQVSDVPLFSVFFTLKNLKCPVFFIPNIWSP
jgi:hypothetical protein